MFKCGQKERGALVSFILYYILVICVTCIIQESAISENITNSLASKNHLLRLKRQQSGTGASPTPSANSNQKQENLSPVSSDSNNNSQDSNNQDDKPTEETLNNLKCDFGTSDSPDLCKFKIIETANPLSKSLTTWSHGSGKLALYQGGPLLDASDRNDTAGGYIFYETSNPYVILSPSSSLNQSLGSYGPTRTAHQGSAFTHHSYDTIRNQPMINHDMMMTNNDYSTISTSAFIKSSHRNDQLTNPENFQQISSARFAVGNNQQQPGPVFISPNLTAPGPSGMCLSFHYAIKGLSAEELRIYVNDHKTERSRQIWASSESAASNWTKGEVLYSVTNIHSIMFTAAGSPTSANKDLQQRKFRGYIALDDIEINKQDPSGGEGACKGHCNFDGDLCGWTNAENGQEDDFDWSFGRGSDNLFTGPPRDYMSSLNNELTGSYLHTDSGYPRRPGDKAVLMSPMFQTTAVNDAMCMKLAVHMFGSGIGSLIIKIRYADDTVGPPAGQPSSGTSPLSTPTRLDSSNSNSKTNNDLTIWEMSGDAGNSWHQAQTSVSSSKSPFQVLIEGIIGGNQLGNIAIDEISFSSGPCPTSPPVASKNYGDCTFEQSMCYWRNPDADIHLDDLDWIRSADEQSIHGPNFDHTLKKRSGSYLKLENTFREPKSGTRAFLLSPIFQPIAQGSVQCLSFYYYMFMRSISSSGPNLGTIRVYLASNNELVPIWRLTNPISSPNWKHGRASLSNAMIDGQPTAPKKLFQIAFEGIWGDAPAGAIAIDDITVFDGACDIMPLEAKSVPGECTFDVDMCSWINKTSDMMTTNLDLTDNSRSPFLQSVNSVSGNSPAGRGSSSSGSSTSITGKRMSWQLATVDSRPVNLQDHTYKAPIGYIYVDVLDGNIKRISFPLQSSEISVQNGLQVTQCLSFWFAAFGRLENNQLNVYITQASSSPPQSDDTGLVPSTGMSSSSRSNQLNPTGSQSQTINNQQSSSSSSSSSSSTNSPSSSGSSSNVGNSDSDGDNTDAWKFIDGKLLWSISLKNITEINRRKWQYGQVSLKADSNYIVRFIALSNDGGFALDDLSYYEGACETRPAQAKVQNEEEDSSGQPLASKPAS